MCRFLSTKVDMATVCVYEIVVKVGPETFDSYVSYIKNTLMKGMLERPGFQRGLITQLADDST